MKLFLRNRLVRFADRLGELEFLLSREDIMKDMKQFLLLSREHTEVSAVASRWSRHSRLQNGAADTRYFGADEWLPQYCRAVEAQQHHDYYVFGHRHLPLDLPIGEHSRYLNLGEWVNYSTYAVYDGHELALKEFEAR